MDKPACVPGPCQGSFLDDLLVDFTQALEGKATVMVLNPLSETLLVGRLAQTTPSGLVVESSPCVQKTIFYLVVTQRM